MSDEHEHKEDEVIHEYDGIQEYDNRLPNWWLWTFIGTVLFGFFYWTGYVTFKSLDNPRDVYEKEVAAARAQEIARLKNAGPVTADLLVKMSQDAKTTETGKQVFTTTCAACHRADGAGNIGPNLTDKYWIHGGKPDQIYQTVEHGVPAKGMPAWEPVIGHDKVMAATAYVLTLKDTNVPGKAPQGDPDI